MVTIPSPARLALAAALAWALWPQPASGQAPPADPPRQLAPLATVPIPEPPDLPAYVRDRAAAVRLGKALFWDMQVGSDVQSCATCHFHAGADHRIKNQLSPGLLAGDTTFQVGGPNHELARQDFPFHRLADPTRRDSAVLFDANDVAGSQGVFLSSFRDVGVSGGPDLCDRLADAVFQVGGVNTRRVEPRNAPTAVNAVFNFRNFWDGRAAEAFNGVDPFGPSNPDARVWKLQGGVVGPVQVSIHASSLASQAVGPPLSPFEMSCGGRTFAHIGRKLLGASTVPLARQAVAPTDGVLGPVARSGTGLTVSYRAMVEQAFQPEWWSGTQPVTVAGQAFTQEEANFSLFFGLAVQLYEATLVADQSPADRFLAGDATALDAQQQRGLSLFTGEGRCVACHGGAETTNASFRNVTNQPVERMTMGDGGCGVYDDGFYNIGVRPTAEDLGVGGVDPFGHPLSFTRRAMQGSPEPTGLSPPLGGVPACDGRAVVDGALKAPGLRNVLLTGPFFHDGGQLDLAQVVAFYDRGGDFADQNLQNLDPDIQPLGLGADGRADLVAFLEGLTDERVRWEQAPFDHPQLFVPDGHPGDEQHVTNRGDGDATDRLLEIPAVGAGGRQEAGIAMPLQPFLASTFLTGGGRLGSGRDLATFGLEGEVDDDQPGIALRYDDHAQALHLRSTGVTAFWRAPGKPCVTASGAARVNGQGGFRFTVIEACDLGAGGGTDTFAITVSGPGLSYARSGTLSGGDLHLHRR
ncbi:MAG TPA: post-COAP-1 domain-containing protein [Anaeromyxobacteraceae bacterium]|nr:post-COAP-1 domain-containing protein [Anaeromyxobacteraceae bacterium]